jgi:5'-3' exonuclease
MNLIVDGSNALHRAYWVAETRTPLVNEQGVWTGPLFIFLKSLKAAVDQFKPDTVWVTWDKKLNYPSTNFRKQLSPENYKTNRDQEKIARVHEQYDVITKFLDALGVKQIYPWVLEADDIISYLVREKCTPATIVSVDKDLLQLVNENVQFYNPIKKKIINYNNFEQETDVKIEHFVCYKALLGDKSDNLPGIVGYGVQKSKKLAEQGYDTIIQTLSESDCKIFEHNITLMNLFGSYTKEEGEWECYEKQYEALKSHKSNMKEFEKLCLEYELNSFARDIDRWKQSFSRENSLLELLSRI